MPSRAMSFSVAGIGPMPMMRGGTAAEAMPSTRAIGVNPCFFAASSDARMSAAAPSFTPEELPAVTVPGVRNGVFSFDSASSVVSLRGCSSRSTTIGPALPPGVSTGTISPLKNPRSCAATARCCERRPNLS